MWSEEEEEGKKAWWSSVEDGVGLGVSGAQY